MSACVHTCADARVQERVPGALKQELQEAASCPTSLLGARLGSPGRAVSILSCGVVSLAPRDFGRELWVSCSSPHLAMQVH